MFLAAGKLEELMLIHKGQDLNMNEERQEDCLVMSHKEGRHFKNVFICLFIISIYMSPSSGVSLGQCTTKFNAV